MSSLLYSGTTPLLSTLNSYLYLPTSISSESRSNSPPCASSIFKKFQSLGYCNVKHTHFDNGSFHIHVLWWTIYKHNVTRGVGAWSGDACR